MKVLVTGGFGTVGLAVVEEGLRRGHAVTVFEVPNRRAERLASRLVRRGVRTALGDIREPGDVAGAVGGQDCVIHLAAILPPVSDARPDQCQAVNVGGTANLLDALARRAAPPALVSVSSASVMGPTQARTPPVRAEGPLAPTDAYSRSKARAEELVAGAGLRFCILRLAAVLPTAVSPANLLSMTRLLFELPLAARCEVVFDLDVAHALVSAAEDLIGPGVMSGRRGFIAGGAANGCQMRTRDLVSVLFGLAGLPVPDPALFASDLESYYLDWYDTGETQRALGYQRHSLDDWLEMMGRTVRPVRPLIRLFQPVIMRWLEGQSRRSANLRYLTAIRNLPSGPCM
jgi:UDP-glucose 4-epimerase